jgi:two-component system, OmpR family, phosphate regulon sensor histidine kinase PhoR
MSTLRTMGTSRRLIFLIVVLVLLPVLFLSAYQIGTFSSSEEMMRDLYRRQLDVMLYSLNQYAWDMSAYWAATLRLQMQKPERSAAQGAQTFLERTPVVESVVLSDSAGDNVEVVLRDGVPAYGAVKDTLVAQLRRHNDRLVQLLRYRSLDYRKLEPFVVRGPSAADQRIALIFANDSGSTLPRFAGLVFREEEFITTMFAGRLTEAAGEEFALGVFRKNQPLAIAASSPMRESEIVQRRDLWLFPDLEVAIGSRGVTLDEIIRARLVRNITFVAVVNIILLAGVVLVYRNVRAQTELARSKSTFVSNVSHELRTPLALIRMFAETLEMGRLKSEQKKQEYYRTILRETERLTHLVNNLLNFSRMEAGRKPYQLARSSIRDIVRDVVTTYMPHLEHAGFTPVVELPQDDVVAAVDREAIAEALINLLDNAVKYSGSKKYLRVRLTRTAGDVRVEVEDQGIGIAPQYHTKIFEAFFRVPSGFVHDTKGSGLGLSLVKHIMDAHGGSIELVSVPDKGTTVRLVFPSVNA